MDMPKEFLDMVNGDIKRIENIQDASLSEKLKLHRELDGRYQACIKDWYNGLWGWNPTKKWLEYSFIESEPTLSENLHMIKSKLETCCFGMNVVRMPDVSAATSVTVNNNLNLNITFEQVRSQVEDMTSLTNEQTEEILDKISEIEKVVNSKDKKKTKWEKIRPVLVWLTDKSCDVGLALLPLLLKI